MGDDPEPAPHARPSVEGPAQQECPLPHPDDAVTSCTALVDARSDHDDGAVTVVEHLDDDPGPVGAEPHLGVGTGTGVLEHVGERLLDDPIGADLYCRRQLRVITINGQGHRQAGRADAGRQGG